MGCGLPVLRLRRDKLMHTALRVFGDEAKARAWLKTDQPSLGGIPDQLVHELDDFQRVLAELESLPLHTKNALGPVL